MTEPAPKKSSIVQLGCMFFGAIAFLIIAVGFCGNGENKPVEKHPTAKNMKDRNPAIVSKVFEPLTKAGHVTAIGCPSRTITVNAKWFEETSLEDKEAIAKAFIALCEYKQPRELISFDDHRNGKTIGDYMEGRGVKMK